MTHIDDGGRAMGSLGEPSLSSLEHYLSPRATVGVESQSHDTESQSLDSARGGAKMGFGFQCSLASPKCVAL
jgi:hypothetical protein